MEIGHIGKDSFSDFPPIGSERYIYIDKLNGNEYYWRDSINDYVLKSEGGAQVNVDVSGKVDANAPITGATKTKVTYDSKGLVTGGADATQDDISDGTTYKQYSQTEKTKLSGIATGATANSSDGVLLDRDNHTGTQTASTISDFNAAATSAAPAETTTSLGILIDTAGSATPNDTDYIFTALTSGGVMKKITQLAQKAFLKTYFDALYAKNGTIPFSDLIARPISGTAGSLFYSDPYFDFVLTSSGGGTKSGEIRCMQVLPADFVSFPAACASLRMYRTIAVTTLEFRAYNSAGTLISQTNVSPSSLNTYQEFTPSISGTWTAGDKIIFVLYFEATNNGSVRYLPFRVNYNR